jgi:membrane fusion protein, multidrug efflux system
MKKHSSRPPVSPGRLSSRQKRISALVMMVLAAWVGWALVGVVRERLAPEPPSAPPPLAVATEVVSAGPFTVERRWRGSVDIDQQALISARVTAELIELPHREGAQISAGDVLFRLDDEELQGERRRLAAVIERIEHELAGARRDLERQQTLIERELAAQKSLDDARQRVDMLGAQLAEARASHDLLLTRLGYTLVRAPFSGRLQRLHLSLGELAAAGKPVLELVADSGFKAVAAVAQADIPWLGPGLPVRLEVPALDRSFKAAIDRVYPALDPATRNATVAALFPDADGALQPGMAVVMHARIAEHEAAITVPAQAVAGAPGEAFVYVFENDSAHRRAVETGPRSGGRVLIVRGLREGETVISSADPRLADGLLVRTETTLP